MVRTFKERVDVNQSPRVKSYNAISVGKTYEELMFSSGKRRTMHWKKGNDDKSNIVNVTSLDDLVLF